MKKFLVLAAVLVAAASSSVYAAEPTAWGKFVIVVRAYAPWYSTPSLDVKNASIKGKKDAQGNDIAQYVAGYTTSTADKIERNRIKSALVTATAAAAAVYGYKYRAQIKKAVCSKCSPAKAA
jgi:hypothetical protein